MLHQIGFHGGVVQHFHGDANLIDQRIASLSTAFHHFMVSSTPVQIRLFSFQDIHHRAICHGELLYALLKHHATVGNVCHVGNNRKRWSQRCF
ncbi:hypothetical protein D3C77_713740 [compost metagenome]